MKWTLVECDYSPVAIKEEEEGDRRKKTSKEKSKQTNRKFRNRDRFQCVLITVFSIMLVGFGIINFQIYGSKENCTQKQTTFDDEFYQKKFEG